MLKDKNIIAFGGFRNTGKDTSASMLQFMLNTPSIFHYYWIFKHFSFLGKLGKRKVTSFARPLKEVLSIILGVPVEKFEDRDFKENYCVNLNTLQIEKIDPFYTPTMTDKFFSKVAKELADEYPNNTVFCVDSLISSLGQGSLAIKASELRAEGKTAVETADFLISNRLKFNQFGTADTLEYLRRAGRVKASKAFFGNLFGVKPIIISDIKLFTFVIPFA